MTTQSQKSASIKVAGFNTINPSTKHPDFVLTKSKEPLKPKSPPVLTMSKSNSSSQRFPPSKERHKLCRDLHWNMDIFPGPPHPWCERSQCRGRPRKGWKVAGRLRVQWGNTPPLIFCLYLSESDNKRRIAVILNKNHVFDLDEEKKYSLFVVQFQFPELIKM